MVGARNKASLRTMSNFSSLPVATGWPRGGHETSEYGNMGSGTNYVIVAYSSAFAGLFQAGSKYYSCSTSGCLVSCAIARNQKQLYRWIDDKE